VLRWSDVPRGSEIWPYNAIRGNSYSTRLVADAKDIDTLEVCYHAVAIVSSLPKSLSTSLTYKLMLMGKI